MTRAHESRWTRRRVGAVGRFLLARIVADFGPVSDGADPVVLRVDPTWATDEPLPEGRQRVGPEDVVAVLLGGRHEFPAGLDEGVEYACWLVASHLQDNIVDDLARPWPELQDGAGRFLAVAEPRFEPLTLAHWSLRGEPLCAVGQLHQAVSAAGLQIARH